jgi:tellurite resistance protein
MSMFESDAIHQRGQALEDEFFHRVDEKLKADLRRSMEREKAREQLSAATGFQNRELLDHLLDAGFNAASLTALALVPIVFVAWADGSVTPKERQAVMSAALQRGLEHDPTALQMLEVWLQKHPSRSLWKLWKEYAEAVHATVSPTLAEMLIKEILRQATIVAEASGGTLGFGKISKDEQAILDEVAKLFSEP